jgi:hypothetical protein
MKYKIVCFQKESLFLSSKEELFRFIDCYTQPSWGKRNAYGIGSIFGNEFIIGNSGGFEISRTTERLKAEGFSQDYHYEVLKVKYVNALFIIYENHTQKVDLDKLKEEYSQSRKIEQYKYRCTYNYDRSTQAYRTREKARCEIDHRNNSFTKEYRDNISAKEAGVKVRASRAKEVETYHVYMYEDSLRYRVNQKNWKTQNKNRKQWMQKVAK